jgi:hypothetical protein
MSKGVLLFAQNNSHIDYIKQAMFCAKRVKQYLNLPVCLATDSLENLQENYKGYDLYFDNVVELAQYQKVKKKKFYNGNTSISLDWHNLSRADAYDITPYNETIVMDTDLIISNNSLLQCFSLEDNFMIAKESKDISTSRSIKSFEKISDKSIDMVWATLFYFKKTTETKILFNLIQHIRENYNFYRLTYKITEVKFRNDFAFAIAIHIINGFKKSCWPRNVPTNLWHILDTDILLDVKNEKITMLVAKEKKYIAASVSGINVHVMNKFSLDEVINGQF